MLKLEATGMLDHSIFEYRDFSEGTMHVETYDPHLRLPDSKYAGADGPHDNYGSALAAQPGKSRGHDGQAVPNDELRARVVIWLLERILREIRRRTRVVGASPDGQSALNLAAARLRHIAGTVGRAV